jgi:hypothetical protein
MRGLSKIRKRELGIYPEDFAVTQYLEVCVCEAFGVSHHFVKPQNIGVPPHHTVDTALRKEAWPQTARMQLLYRHTH